MLFTTLADDAALGIAALALTSTVLLLLNLVNGTTARAWKLGVVVVAFAALVVAWRSMIGVLGLPTTAPLPAHYQVLASRVVEPDVRVGEPGVVLLWVAPLASGDLPRAHAVPYSSELHRQIVALIESDGPHEQLYGRGDGAGGIELYRRAVRPPPKTNPTR